MATPANRIQVMLLTGSNDPANATRITELAELTYLVSSAGTFEDVVSIAVPSTSSSSNIAFVYQSTNNWFTPRVDDVHIPSAPASIEETMDDPGKLTVYPTPAENEVQVRVDDVLWNGRVTATDASGKDAVRLNSATGSLDISVLFGGAYTLQVKQGRTWTPHLPGAVMRPSSIRRRVRPGMVHFGSAAI